MTTATWDQLYGRPAISRDAVLLVVALALHAPLLLLQMKAPPKRHSLASSTINVKFIESQFKSNWVPPPALPLVKKPPIDLVTALKNMGKLSPGLPVANVPAPGPVNITQLATIPPAAPLAPPSPGVVGNSIGILPTAGPVLPTPVAKDRGSFAVKSGDLASLAPVVPIQGAREIRPIEIPVPSQLDQALAKRQPLSMSRTAPVGPLKIDNGPTSGPAIEPAKATGPPIPIPSNKNTELVKADPLVVPPPTEIVPSKHMERRLSGIPITGPLANRPVRYQEVPEYPEWARAQGIEATVELIFKVGPDGRVKNDIIVAKGSGEPRLDRHVMNAVLRWIFEPLPEEAGNREDVGTVVFRFSMK